MSSIQDSNTIFTQNIYHVTADTYLMLNNMVFLLVVLHQQALQYFNSKLLLSLRIGLRLTIYTDFSKGFDRVDYELLVTHLKAIGFSGSFLSQ